MYRGRCSGNKGTETYRDMQSYDFRIYWNAYLWYESRLRRRWIMRQLFLPDSNTWVYHEKYWGKQLKADDMLYAIASFLYNGESLRHDILDSMLEKLYDIRDCVKQVVLLTYIIVCNHLQSTWRFWSSSLLIVYDAIGSRVDIHLIDFANCNFQGNYTTPDEVTEWSSFNVQGYLLGVSNLIAMLTLIKNHAIDENDLKDKISLYHQSSI